MSKGVFMDITKFKQELNEFIQAFTEPDSWQNLNTEKQNIIIERALADITAHAKKLCAALDFEIPEVKRAFFEQVLHLVKQFPAENDRTIIEETISGFGSRRYLEPDETMLSERSKYYLDSSLKQNKFVRTAR